MFHSKKTAQLERVNIPYFHKCGYPESECPVYAYIFSIRVASFLIPLLLITQNLAIRILI